MHNLVKVYENVLYFFSQYNYVFSDLLNLPWTTLPKTTSFSFLNYMCTYILVITKKQGEQHDNCRMHKEFLKTHIETPKFFKKENKMITFGIVKNNIFSQDFMRTYRTSQPGEKKTNQVISFKKWLTPKKPKITKTYWHFKNLKCHQFLASVKIEIVLIVYSDRI